MTQLIKCKHSSCSDRMCLRSGKSFPRSSTIEKKMGSDCKPRNNLKLNLTRGKQKVSPSRNINGEKQTQKQVATRRKKSSDMKDKIESEDLIREILLRLPWSTISCYKTVCRRWLELVSDPVFTAGYLSTNSFLLGFSYAKAEDRIKIKAEILAEATFIPLAPARNCCPEYCNLLQVNVEMSKARKFYSRCLTEVLRERLLESHCFERGLLEAHDLNLSCCCGIILRLQVRGPSIIFSLHNPISGQSVFLPRPPDYDHYFVSYGLVIDFSSSQSPHLIAIEVMDIVGYSGRLRVNTFSSKTRSWQSKEHDVEPFLGGGVALSRRGISLNGVIYWLARGSCSGVVAYDTRSESFCFSFLNIPYDQVEDECFCRSLNHFILFERRSCVSGNTCMCRFLGQSQNRLCYVRFIGDFEISMWIVDSGEWSDGKRYILHALPDSLAYGRILSIDPQDCNLLYIRLKKKIFSYHLEFHQLKEIYTIDLEGASDKPFIKITPIIPYEAPKLPSWLSLRNCFDSLFGSSLCYKDSCWGDGGVEFMIHPDAHLHDIGDSKVQSGGAIDNNLPHLLESLSDNICRSSHEFTQDIKYVSVL